MGSAEFIAKLNAKIDEMHVDVLSNLAGGMYQPLDWMRGLQGHLKGLEAVRDAIDQIVKAGAA